MHKTLGVALVSLGLAAVGPAQAQEIPGSAFKVGGYWQGSAQNGEDGRFLYCSVSIVHGAGQELWFLLRRDDTFHIVLTTGAASFTPGEQIETRLSINNGEPFQAFASATDAQSLLWSFPQVDHSVAYFRQSELLTLAVSPKQTITLGTPEIAAALDATQGCLQFHSAPG
jgi:hypothetical protein